MLNQTDFVNFVEAIPKEQNPYPLVEEYLRAAVVPAVPKGYPFLLGLNFFLLTFAITQSTFILYVLITTKRFSLVNITPLGLWKVDTVSATAILAWVYCLLATIETLSVEISRNRMRLNFWRTKALLAIRKGESSPNTVIFSSRFRSAMRPDLTFGQLFVMS
ncbi:hypothetical protein O181_008164 [Austropuccinia psidii MF-1]|uniref:Uncharacterized protein n=1 Tax=Austropuccinia psidii MF-1 TaxID=1389203 RepID=A0A9Q3BM61_9BASI|nr:hypothetical protein [Austropuccinia psidii MF-1]